MTDLKVNRITLRLNNEEKARLEKEATSHCMALSQFLRYKLLEYDLEIEHTDDYLKPIKKQLNTVSRAVIEGYFYTIKLAKKTLSAEERKEICVAAYEEFKKLGITKDGSND